MKFLLECVGCCRSAASPPREEIPFLIVDDRSIRNGHGKRRRDWRPSLSAISEEYVETERVKRRNVKVGSETRRRNRKISPGSTTTRIHVGGYNGGSGGFGSGQFMPTAFAASPFMF